MKTGSLARWMLCAAGGVCAATAAAPYAVPDAVPYVYPYNMMTAQQVVDTLLKQPVTPAEHVERDRVHSYVNGLKDGTQGREWCFSGGMLPHELNLEMAGALKASRSGAQLKGNAAPVVLAELRRRYPCAATKGDRQ